MRSHGTEIPSAAAVQLAAEATVRMHEEERERFVKPRCAQCPDDPADCPQYRWAKSVLAIRAGFGES